MIRIENMKDLRHIGIDTLTGEACAYMRRTLCGLTEAGANLVCDFYGIMRTGLRDPWNSRACDEKAVASFMLPSYLASNMDLALVGLFRLGCIEVWEPRRENMFADRGPDDQAEPVDYAKRKAAYPRQFEGAGLLLGIQPVDLDTDMYKRMTMQAPVAVGDIQSADYCFILRRMYNPGRSRNQHQMSKRVE